MPLWNFFLLVTPGISSPSGVTRPPSNCSADSCRRTGRPLLPAASRPASGFAAAIFFSLSHDRAADRRDRQHAILDRRAGRLRRRRTSPRRSSSRRRIGTSSGPSQPSPGKPADIADGGELAFPFGDHLHADLLHPVVGLDLARRILPARRNRDRSPASGLSATSLGLFEQAAPAHPVGQPCRPGRQDRVFLRQPDAVRSLSRRCAARPGPWPSAAPCKTARCFRGRRRSLRWCGTETSGGVFSVTCNSFDRLLDELSDRRPFPSRLFFDPMCVYGVVKEMTG